MPGRRWTLPVAVALLVLAAAPAAAQVEGGGDYQGRTPRTMREGMPYDPDIVYPGSGHLGVDLAFFYRDYGGGDEVRVFAPVVEGWYAPTERLAFSLSIPFVLVGVGVDGIYVSVQRLANVTLGGHLGVRTGRTDLRAGLEVATPTARIGEADTPEREPAIRATYHLASVVRGHRQPWLWWPERLSALVPIRFGYRLHPLVTLSVHATGALGFAAGDDEGDSVEAAGVVYPEISAGAGVLVGGLRVPLSASTRRRYQVSVEPFLRLFLDTAFLSVGFTLNLAGDSAFGFSDDGVWSVHIGGGTVFGEGQRQVREDPDGEGSAGD